MNRRNHTNTDVPTSADETCQRGRFTLKDWALEDRPREKLIAKGKKELSNAELIAILLGSGSVGQSAVGLAQELLNSHGNSLSALSRQGIRDLTQGHKGMGTAKAVSVIAALELGYRMLGENIILSEPYIRQSSDFFNYISPMLIDLQAEEFWAVYMNNRNKILFRQRISVGGITDTPVDVRKIFATALEKSAVCVAIAHNHPSGNLTPSKQDKALTDKIAGAGKILNIPLIEHIIVGIDDNRHPSYYSFHDNGLL